MDPKIVYVIIGSMFTLVIGFDIYNWSRHHTLVTPEIKIQKLRFMVNVSVLLIASTLVLASVLFRVNILQYKSPIEYSNIRSITLKDFKGFKMPNQTLDGMREFAFITTSIEWKRTDTEVEVKSLFHPSRSYIFNENVADRLLLQHELYHFHIVEYFARRIRKEVNDFKTIPADDVIASVVSANKALEKRMQFAYDNDTYHGYVLKEQKRWQLKIDSVLTLHQDFSNIKITYK